MNDSASGYYNISTGKKGQLAIHFKGRMDLKTSPIILSDLCPIIRSKSPDSLLIDLAQVSYFDDFGALVIVELKNMMSAQAGHFEIVDTNGHAKKILSLIDLAAFEKSKLEKRKRQDNIFVRLGDATITEMSNIRFLISFMGSVFISLFKIFFRPKLLRFGDIVSCMEKTGANAVPIVGLISFLLGLVMAFMSSLQLQQFGANIYVASLVAIAMVSELGPIMTAIVVAGRSGSAFAAEIGTMKISEEVDALVIMGLDPTLFLAVPRIIATIVVVPLLTLFSDLFAIGGGLVVGIFMLDLSATSYLNQTIKTLTLFEVTWGMMKSIVFAFLISWIGCLRGFQTRGGADAVGNSATSAVVSSIFLIILFDSIFAVMRSYW